MSKYTTEVRFICEMKSGYPTEEMSSHSVDDIISKSYDKIFNFDYPIFDVNYKKTLESKILKHYYTREIGAETFELWRTWLNAMMNEIMPKYNVLYLRQLEFADKLFNNIDVTTNGITIEKLKEILWNTREDKFKGLFDGDSRTTYSNDEVNKNAFSDTPQGSLTFNETDNGDVWLTDFRRINDHNDGNSTTITKNETNNTDNVRTDQEKTNDNKINNDVHEYGYRGGKTFMELINDLADKFVNIDMMIINDLSILFFKLW